jgi:hypothetical protein
MRGALATLAAVLALLGTASAASGNATHQSRPTGLVPHLAQAGAAGRALSKVGPFAAPGFLTFDASYESAINQYFTDVAHDSGGTSNVYSVATQYGDGTGFVQYQSTFGGSYVDHDPLPPNGCDDGQDSVCLTDPQLQAEIQNVLTATGWHGSTAAMFVLMTPNGVGSCFDGTSQECTTNTYCAYHNAFTDSRAEPVIYANEPYNATIDGCDPGSSPNSDDADATINTISHEHNEAITDPFGDAWWRDSDGQENGDLCAWDFGAKLGGTTGVDAYNQLINGHHYWLQQEWSNSGSGCFQNSTQESGPTKPSQNLDYHGGLVMHTNTTYAIYWLPRPGNTALPVVTGTAAVSQTLTSSVGSWNGSPTGFSYQWQRCSSAASGCVNIPGATASRYTLASADGGTYVRSTVSAANVNGASAYTASAGQVVAPLPAATSLPVVSGVAAVGKKLSTTSGSWNTAATFAYQWLRCAADGSACTTISGAASATYVAVGADVGHTLEVRVSATNHAGATAALSNHSAVVVGVPKATKAPGISGRAHVGKRLAVVRGSWSGPPKSYRYQWLRCNSHGGSCRKISHATHSTYRLTKLDSGHRLRVRVSAVNAAGTGTASSKATAKVPAARKHS